ncbi:phage tail tape measure protein [Apilactobacillus sp. EABW-1NA]|uniref:phage tail tape measure protein n=1 Tax=Apilactobacillus sp. EABW-1NA TaxID=2984137 RepID=UPI0025AEDF48|nr:phage tail tape measure protein [Apilactobacillus sp. EABW-1NA]MDN2613423.1 phage tail tape measure protein [Apilactobacillus sp. EABW-1NA]
MADVSRRATIEIPVKVDQKAIDSFNKALTKMTKSGGSVQKTLTGLSKQLDSFTKSSSDFAKNYKNTFDKVSESNKQALESSKKFTNQAVSGNNRVTKSIEKMKAIDDSATKSSTSNTNTRTDNNNRLSRSQSKLTQKASLSVAKFKRLNDVGDKFLSIGRNMGLVTLGLGAAFISGAKKAIELQNQYVKIKNLAVTGGEHSVEAQRNVNKMRQQGVELSLKYGVSQEKIGKGYEELIRRGYSTNQTLATQKQFLQASIASGDDYTDVVHNATSAIESFGLKTNNSSKMAANTKTVLNQMAYAADLTATDFNGMGEALKYVGASAHNAHQSIAETSSAIGILSNNGLDASQAGTGLRQVLSRLVAPKKGASQNVLKQLGLSAQDFRDAKGNLLPLQDVFSKLNDKMKGMSSTDRGAIFNALFGQTGQQAATILSNNVKQLKDLNGQVEKSQKQNHGKGYIAELSAKNSKTAKVQIGRFKAAIEQLKITFANELLPTFSKVANGMSDLIAKLSSAPGWLKKIVAYGTVFVAGIAPVSLVVGSLTKSFGAIGLAIGKLRKMFTTPVSKTMGNSMVKESGKMRTACEITGSGNSSSGLGDGLQISRVERNGRNISKMTKFKSIFGGVEKTGTRFGKVGNFAKIGGTVAQDATRVGRFGGLTRGLGMLGSKIPYLDIAVAGSQLIGMNHKNAGSKIGSAGGMLGGTLGGSALGASIGSVVPGIGTAVGGLAGGAIGGIAGSSAGKWIGKKVQSMIPKGFFDPLIKGWNKAKKILKDIGNAFKNTFKPLKNIFKPVGKAFNNAMKTIKKAISPIKKIFRDTFKSIKKAFKPVTDGWKYMMKAFKSKQGKKNIKALASVMKWLNKQSQNVVKLMVKAFSWLFKKAKPIFKAIGVTFKVAMSLVKAVAKGAGAFLKSFFKGTFKIIGNLFEAFADVFTGNWKHLGKDLKGIVRGVVDILKAPFKALGAFFGSIWDDIKKAFQKGLHAVVDFLNGGINGINKLLSYVGGSGHTIPTIKFASGTSGSKQITKGTHAMLNDGHDSPETGNKELAILPNGKAFIPQQRNWTGWLPAGTQILNAKETKAFMNSQGIEHYAGGGIIGGIESFASSAGKKVKSFAGSAVKVAKSIGGKVVDDAEAIGNAIAHPIKTVMNMFGGFTSNIPIISDFGGGIINKAKDLIASWFQKETDDGGSSNPSGSGVQRWKPSVIKALSALGLSTSGDMVNRVLRQINTESGGNPNAVGGTDGLADGRAMGLMQVKPGTFAAYGKPGLGGWNNGYASIYAGLNYARHRYGDSLSFLGNGHGYANGGWSSQPAVFGEYPGQPEVAINPKRKSADRLIMEAISARAKSDGSSPFAKLMQSKSEKTKRNGLVSMANSLISKSSRGLQQPQINMNVEININGNADTATINQLPSKLQQAVEQVVQRMAHNAIGKI